MKKLTIIGLSLLMIALITGCADVTHVEMCMPVGAHTYGFWGGVWHGMISQISFIGSLFSDDIAVYAINNNGAWYNFGFVGGFGVMVRVVIWILKGIFGK